MSEDDDEPTAEEPAAESPEAADADAAETEEDEAGLSEGDFVSIEYTIRTVEDGRLVDTTDEAIAEEEEIDTEGREFSPRTVVLGGGYLFPGVDEELTGKTIGDDGSIEIRAEDAFGEFDPEDVRTISANRLPEDDRQPGAQVTVDGDQGIVETVIGGRARVDFNHPLAGEDLEYDYEIVDVVEDRLERAKTLLSAHLDMDLSVTIDVEEDEEVREVEPEDEEGEPETETELVEYETLYIEATPQLTMNQQWMFSKQQIADELRDRIGVDRVVVREVLDGGGMMGGMGGMMGGMGGGVEEGDIESAIEEADLDEDVDADEVLEELETENDA